MERIDDGVGLGIVKSLRWRKGGGMFSCRIFVAQNFIHPRTQHSVSLLVRLLLTCLLLTLVIAYCFVCRAIPVLVLLFQSFVSVLARAVTFPVRSLIVLSTVSSLARSLFV